LNSSDHKSFRLLLAASAEEIAESESRGERTTKPPAINESPILFLTKTLLEIRPHTLAPSGE
jgi:hypothetical protein